MTSVLPRAESAVVRLFSRLHETTACLYMTSPSWCHCKDARPIAAAVEVAAAVALGVMLFFGGHPHPSLNDVKQQVPERLGCSVAAPASSGRPCLSGTSVRLHEGLGHSIDPSQGKFN